MRHGGFQSTAPNAIVCEDMEDQPSVTFVNEEFYRALREPDPGQSEQYVRNWPSEHGDRHLHLACVCARALRNVTLK